MVDQPAKKRDLTAMRYIGPRIIEFMQWLLMWVYALSLVD